MGSTATPDPLKHVKVNPPFLFDGKASDFRSWLRMVIMFHQAYKIVDDNTKISVALSYIEKGSAADQWVQSFVDTHTNPSTQDIDLGKWSQCLADLTTRFKDHNFAQKAREELEHFKQGSKLVDVYIAELEQKFTEAGFPTDSSADPEKCRLLEKGIISSILSMVYSGVTSVPTTYDTYKQRVLEIGRIQERHRQIHHASLPNFIQQRSKPFQAPSQSSTQQPRHNFVTNLAPPKSDNTPKYVPMEIDKTRQPPRCYGCGKMGHMRNDCPDGKTKLNIRALIEQLQLDEEEYNELVEETLMQAQTKEDYKLDFVDGL